MIKIALWDRASVRWSAGALGLLRPLRTVLGRQWIYWCTRTLRRAAWVGDIEMLALLVRCGAALNEREDRGGMSALMVAANRGQRRAVEYLLMAGAEIDAENRMGATALMLAVRAGHYDVVHCLLEAGARVNTFDHLLFSPLACAAANDDIPMMELLLANGANINGRVQNISALHWAIILNRGLAARWLEQHGAAS